jgi:GTPase SAR1 family protein
MHKILSGDGSRRTIILHGLGGVGKTQLTVAYAQRHKNGYSAIFWLNIKDEDSLKQSFANIAKQILPDSYQGSIIITNKVATSQYRSSYPSGKDEKVAG